jgi:hypothetical protein
MSSDDKASSRDSLPLPPGPSARNHYHASAGRIAASSQDLRIHRRMWGNR